MILLLKSAIEPLNFLLSGSVFNKTFSKNSLLYTALYIGSLDLFLRLAKKVYYGYKPELWKETEHRAKKRREKE